MTAATWTNTKTGKTVSGEYRYLWAWSLFQIRLSTGRKFTTTGDCRWGNWRLTSELEQESRYVKFVTSQVR
jgi:hypothetical protein